MASITEHEFDGHGGHAHGCAACRIEELEDALSALRARETGLREAMHAIYKGLSSEKDGEFWTAQKWCDDHDIYVDNLQGLRVLEEIARVVLSEGAK